VVGVAVVAVRGVKWDSRRVLGDEALLGALACRVNLQGERLGRAMSLSRYGS
jgi:hypothetical protein